MSDQYLAQSLESINILKYDVRAEYDWWIENGASYDDARDFALAGEQQFYANEQCRASVKRFKELGNARN